MCLRDLFYGGCAEKRHSGAAGAGADQTDGHGTHDDGEDDEIKDDGRKESQEGFPLRSGTSVLRPRCSPKLHTLSLTSVDSTIEQVVRSVQEAPGLPQAVPQLGFRSSRTFPLVGDGRSKSLRQRLLSLEVSGQRIAPRSLTNES